MQLITEMPLPYLPVEEPAFHKDPMPFVEAARGQHPWLARFSSGYIVHGYHALKDLAMMDDKLDPGFGGIVEFYNAKRTMWGQFMEQTMISQSGAVHARLRASLAAAFTPRSANEARSLMRDVITVLLDEWAPRGSFDFADFASYFPVTVMCGLLGISAEPIPRVRSSIEDHMASLNLDHDLYPKIMAAWDVLWNLADTLIVEREANAKADSNALLDALIAARNNGQLDDTELRFQLVGLLVGGYDTTKNMLIQTMHLLLHHPQYWQRCAADLKYCGKVVDEALRHSGIATFFRLVGQDFDYDGLRFPRGALLTFATPLADRDPAAYADPMRFDPDRVVGSTRHVAFGRGAHICIGQFLAKAMLDEGLHLIAQRIDTPRPAGEATWQPFLGVWGPRTLPIGFELRT